MNRPYKEFSHFKKAGDCPIGYSQLPSFTSAEKFSGPGLCLGGIGQAPSEETDQYFKLQEQGENKWNVYANF